MQVEARRYRYSKPEKARSLLMELSSQIHWNKTSGANITKLWVGAIFSIHNCAKTFLRWGRSGAGGTPRQKWSTAKMKLWRVETPRQKKKKEKKNGQARRAGTSSYMGMGKLCGSMLGLIGCPDPWDWDKKPGRRPIGGTGSEVRIWPGEARSGT